MQSQLNRLPKLAEFLHTFFLWIPEGAVSFFLNFVFLGMGMSISLLLQLGLQKVGVVEPSAVCMFKYIHLVWLQFDVQSFLMSIGYGQCPFVMFEPEPFMSKKSLKPWKHFSKNTFPGSFMVFSQKYFTRNTLPLEVVCLLYF